MEDECMGYDIEGWMCNEVCLWEEYLPMEIKCMILSFFRGDVVTSVVCRFVSRDFKTAIEQTESIKSRHEEKSLGFATKAAASGSLPILQWARRNGCPWHENICEYAAMMGHMSVVAILTVGGKNCCRLSCGQGC